METDEFDVDAELRDEVRRYAVAGLLAVVTIGAVLNAASFWTITVDDSYISLRYARNLIEGHGLVYNPGDRVEGFSNPPWVMLMALTLLLGADSLEGIKLIALVAHGVGVVTAAGLARELVKPQTWSGEAAIPIGAGFLAVSLPASFWPSTGLETVFYTTLLTGTAWRLLVELREPRRRPLSAALAGLAAITRPEATLLVAGLVAGRLWAAWRPKVLEGREPRSLLPWLGIFAVPTVGYLAFRLIYYGKPLANTAYQKGHSAPLWALQDYVRPWLSLEAPFLVVGAAGLLALAARRWRTAWPILALFAGQLFFLLWVCRDWMPNQRFLVPALPFLAVGAAAGAALLADAAGARVRWAVPLALALVVAGQARASLPLRETEYNKREDTILRLPREEWMTLPDALRHTWKGHSDVPIWLMERARPGATVAYTDIGLTGWVTDVVIVDLAGLTDGVLSGATGLDWPGRAAYLGERAPDWIILKPNGEQRFEAISSSAWLVENYDLEAGPRGTLAGQRKGVERATPEEIYASFSRAAVREPRSRTFLWKRVQWAAIAGTKKQLAAACAAVKPWPDMAEAGERCEKMKPGRPVPDIPVEPLPAPLMKHFASTKAEKKAAASAAQAGGGVDANPFARPGKHGVGAGWAPLPEDQASLARLEDGALVLAAQPAGAFQVCDKKRPLTGTSVTVRGAWQVEGLAASGPRHAARLTIGAYDKDKRLIGPPGGTQKLWTVASGREDLGWTDIAKTLEMPPGVEMIRLCAALAADAGTARLRDLRVEMGPREE